jgi:3,4-dihydroxy 2-butanone 4-phosphate synthase / GTP cyclohydrolase II
MRCVAAKEKRGAVVVLRDTSERAVSSLLAPQEISPQTLRQYGLGAQILGALGITEMILLTNSPARRIVGLEGYGLTVTGTRPITEREDG